MDLLGDIVEKEVSAPEPPTFTAVNSTGFPKPKHQSAWKQRQQRRRHDEQKEPTKTTIDVDAATGMKRLPKDQQKMDYEGLTEAERIHMENIEILSKMSDEERARQKEELLGTMDPKILKALLRRTEKKEQELTGLKRASETGEDFEGYGTWIGGGRNGEAWKEQTLDDDAVNDALNIKPAMKSRRSGSTTSEKRVRFDNVSTVNYSDEPRDEEWEDIENLDDIAPPSYQIVQEASEVPLEEAMSTVHFPKAPVAEEMDYKLDINDPDFDEKLHEKFFPDLPRDTEKLQWMEPAPAVDTNNLVFNNVSDLRFDFKGNMMVPTNNNRVDTHEGLHHHADDPSLAGYTLKELAHLARSSVPGQRCVALQTLGRVLHKLGKGKYNIVPEFTDEDDEPVTPDQEALKKASTEFDQMFWGLIDELRIIETLEEAADEQFTRNLSVRNYATEALWLWRQGGGNTRHAN